MINDIMGVIRHSHHVLLSAHENPDGDAIGALVSMAGICICFKVPYTILIEQVSEEYVFLTENMCTQEHFGEEYDTFVCLDCGDKSRLGIAYPYFEKAQTTINIDHHATNDYFGEYNYVEKDASSTCELIFNMIEEAQIPITPKIAQAIYTGIVTDTGGFMHSCTKSSTHSAAARLLTIPFDFSTIYYRLIHQKTEKTMRLEGVTAQHLVKTHNEKVFISYITHEDLEMNNATREDASSIVSYIKHIKGCEIAVFIYPTKEQQSYKVSLRCNAPYNVAEIAATFGGGGHIRAAGATVMGELDEVIATVTKRLEVLE